MLSIQQLIKALRKLQNNTTLNGGDLVKSIKYVAVNASNGGEGEGARSVLMTSLVNNQQEKREELLNSTVTLNTAETSSMSPKQQQQQQQQKTNDSSKISNTTKTTSSSCSNNYNNDVGDGDDVGNNTKTKTTITSSQQTLKCHNECFSLYSSLNADGSEILLRVTTQNSTTQDSLRARRSLTQQQQQQQHQQPPHSQQAVISTSRSSTTTITTPQNPQKIYTARGQNQHQYQYQYQQQQRSQRIQNFFQQQIFHHQQFHTQQHNPNLNTKQKQTQFAMSSLAAAVEPSLALQQKDEPNGNGASDNESSSSSSSNKSPSNQKNSASGKPCFNSGLGDIIQFMELIGNLKHTKRTGWVLRDVNDCESISGHMYRMSILTFLLDGTEGLNQIRCMELALVHDLAESLVGDITPFCGISKEEKKAMELKAMEDICKLIEPRGKRMMELFEEYEHGESPESRFVKDLDRLDMVMQAFEYEKRDNCLLRHQEFFDSTEGKFNHPFVKKLVNEIYEQREKLAKAKGATPPPKIEVPNMDNPETHAKPSQTTNGQHIEDKVESSKSS